MSRDVRILLVDDQPDFVETISFWMKTKGYQVTSAPDGPGAMDTLKKNSFDVVFVDFKMPGMNGVEALQKIREFNKTIPVIMVTAHADDAMVHQIKDLNISGFFSKMSDYKELERVFKAVLSSIQKTDRPSA